MNSKPPPEYSGVNLALGASSVFEKSSSFVIRTKVGQEKWRKKGGRNLSRISSEKGSGCVWNRNKIENRLKLSDAPDSKHQSSLRRINFSNATRSLPFPPLPSPPPSSFRKLTPRKPVNFRWPEISSDFWKKSEWKRNCPPFLERAFSSPRIFIPSFSVLKYNS